MNKTHQYFLVLEDVIAVFTGAHVRLGDHAILDVRLQILVADAHKSSIDTLAGRFLRIEREADAADLQESSFQFRILGHGILQSSQQVIT